MKIINKTPFLMLVLLLVVTSCEVAPKEIVYGDDHCHFCDMTVVDKRFAAQYVTKKGKNYVFDAVECLVMKINKDQHEETLAFILVADYSNPGNLADVEKSTYLISEKIKSPMGENLSAFSLKSDALKKQLELGGNLYTWEELKIKLLK